MTFEQALKKFADTLSNAVEQAAFEPEAAAQSLKDVPWITLISASLQKSGLRLAQVQQKGTVEEDHRS